MYIAFTGKKSHGKSTAARTLEPLGYAHLNYADPVREVAKIVYGLTDEEMLDPVLKEIPIDRWPYKSPREILQQIGTEMFRNYLSDTWTECQARRMKEATAAGARGIACSDLRFFNEEHHVRCEGGIVIRVVDPRKPEATDKTSKHISETEMEGIKHDFLILNDGTVEELQAKVMDIYNRLMRADQWAAEFAKEINDAWG